MGWGEKRGWMLIMLRIEYSRMMTMKMWKALSERLTGQCLELILEKKSHMDSSTV